MTQKHDDLTKIRHIAEGPKRTCGIAAAVLLIGLLLCTFYAPAHSDPAAIALIKNVTNAMNTLHSASGSMTMSAGPGMSDNAEATNIVGEFKFTRPNLLREDDWMVQPSGRSSSHRLATAHYITASNGTTYWAISPDGSMSTGKVDANGDNLSDLGQSGNSGLIASMFFGPDSIPDFGPGSQVTLGKDQVWHGTKCRTILISSPEISGGSGETGQSYTIHGEILIGPDLLVRRFVMDAGKMGHLEIAFTILRIGSRFTKADFRFEPPRWAKVVSAQKAAPSPVKVTVDAPAMRVFAIVNARMRSIRTLSADFTDTMFITSVHDKKPRWSNMYHSGTLKLMRPNYARSEYREIWTSTNTKPPKYESPEIIVSDGTTLWHLWDSVGKFYESAPVKPDGSNIQLYYCELVRGSFFTGEPYESGMTGWDRGHVFYAGSCTWRGATYQRIEARLFASDGTSGGTFTSVQTILVGQDGLVHESYEVSSFDNGTVLHNEQTLTNVQINPDLKKSDFAYSLPVGSTEKVEFPDVNSAPPPPLLANGSAAPDFTVYDPQGNSVKLSDFSGKVVVLDFWATWCGPCQMSLPHTNALANKLAGQNVQFLAVNVWDTKDAFDSWLPQHKQFQSLKFVIDTTPVQGDDIAQKLYHVTGIPTQFVIDPSGKIVNSFVGYDPDTTALTAAVTTAENK
jgi:outer membrane lipoprotein-sorting protein/thiol-disulfide isomerase/thioredoxin